MNIENMTHYRLDKGANLDTDGRNLRNYINTNFNLHAVNDICVVDDGLATIQNFNQMFASISNAKHIDLANVNISNVKDMSLMFYGCNNLLETIINSNTSNVTTMINMFDGCENLTSVPNFNTSNVTSMTGMFGYYMKMPVYQDELGCHNLISVPNYNTSKVTSMISMFRECTNLTTVPNFNTSKVTNMSYMFYNCRNLTEVPDLDTSNVTYMSRHV